MIAPQKSQLLYLSAQHSEPLSPEDMESMLTAAGPSAMLLTGISVYPVPENIIKACVKAYRDAQEGISPKAPEIQCDMERVSHCDFSVDVGMSRRDLAFCNSSMEGE